MSRSVAVLFARADSVYKTFDDCDVWDAERDARLWPGGAPIVAHPPCAQWAALKGLATPDAALKALAPLAIELVRQWGGVVEHPAGSSLWSYCGLPLRGTDIYGGRTVGVLQMWWGHKARKATWLYVCGVRSLPPIPYPGLGMRAAYVIDSSRRRELNRQCVPKSEREHTPEAFAH